MIKDNWWWIGDIGQWFFSTVTVLLAFYLGLRVRKPRLKITVRINAPTDRIEIAGANIMAMIHNSGSEVAYIRDIKLVVFGVQSSANFYVLPEGRELANNPIPANGAEDFYSPVAEIINAWKSLPRWKKWIAAVTRNFRVTVIVQDAGGNVYKGAFYYPWTGE